MTTRVEETGLATVTEHSQELSTAAASAEKQHEIQSAIIIAKRFPRSEDRAFEKLTKACKRTSFAEDAAYSFPRGGSEVRGPSVNLAREAARVWGNIRYGISILKDDDDSILLQGWAWDVEENVKVTSEDSFKKLVYRKGKGWIKPDERDLRELINRRGAIAVRNCILQLLPKDLIEDAMALCRQTLSQQARQDPDAVRKKLILSYSEFNITPDMIAEYLAKSRGQEEPVPLNQATPDEIADLRQIYKSIKDGNSKWSEYVNGNASDEKKKNTGKLNLDNLKAGDAPEKPDGKQEADKAEAKEEAEEPEEEPEPVAAGGGPGF